MKKPFEVGLFLNTLPNALIGAVSKERTIILGYTLHLDLKNFENVLVLKRIFFHQNKY
jgi:hypothetical protein